MYQALLMLLENKYDTLLSWSGKNKNYSVLKGTYLASLVHQYAIIKNHYLF